MNNCKHEWEGASDPNYWHCIKCDKIESKVIKVEDKLYTLSGLERLLKEYNKEHWYYVMHGDDEYTPENFLKWLKKKEEK